MISDTQRLEHFKLSEKLRFLEKKIYLEAKKLNIDIKLIQKEVQEEAAQNESSSAE